MPNVKSVIDGSRAGGSSLMFPRSGEAGKYGMLFMFDKYKYEMTDGVVTYGGGGGSEGQVVLPLPNSGLAEVSNISYSEENLGLTGGLFASGSAAGKGGGVAGLQAWAESKTSEAQGLTSKAFDGTTNDYASIIRVAGSAAARELPAGAGAGIAVGTGVATNNFTALAFNNVGLRTHQFTWRLFPEAPEDSDALAEIRNKFQVAAHPEYSDSGGGTGTIGRALLNYPMLVRPIILIDEAEKYYYQYKPCLIQDVGFNYRTEGGMAVLKGGKPAVIELSLTLKETAIWTSEDFSGQGGGTGGVAG